MNLCVSSLVIADIRIQGVTLRPVLGAYELIFGLYVTIHAQTDYPRTASILGARVGVKAGGDQNHALGFARPEVPFEVKQCEHSSPMTPALVLTLQPGQLAALEHLRETNDLNFELKATGTGIDKYGEQQVQDTWRIYVPRSDWIKRLREAYARDILLLEVPIPLRPESPEWSTITNELRRAEKYFRDGDYHATVSTCRAVVQELGHHNFQDKNWSGSLLSRLANERNGMSKADREAALWAALRHYTHQAHHTESEGGVSSYGRSDAQFVLTLAASLVAHYLAD